MALPLRALTPLAWLPLATIPVAGLVFLLPGPTLTIAEQRELVLFQAPVAMALVLVVTLAASLYATRILYGQGANAEAPPLLALAPMLVPPVVCVAFSNRSAQHIVTWGCSPLWPEVILTGAVGELGTFRVLALALPAAGALCIALAALGSPSPRRPLLTLAGLSVAASLFTAAWASMAAQKGILAIASPAWEPDDTLLVLLSRYGALARAADTLLVSAVVLALSAGIETTRGGGLRATSNVLAVLVLGVFPRAIVALETALTNDGVERQMAIISAGRPTLVGDTDGELSSLAASGCIHGHGLGVGADAAVELHALEPSLQRAQRLRCDRLVFHRPLRPLTVPPAFSVGARLRERYQSVSPAILRADTGDCFDTVTLEGGAMRLQREGTAWARGPALLRIADEIWGRPCVRIPGDSLSTLDVTSVAEAAVANGYVLAIAVRPEPD